jgi:hypothetical protein
MHPIPIRISKSHPKILRKWFDIVSYLLLSTILLKTLLCSFLGLWNGVIVLGYIPSRKFIIL